MSLYRKDAVVPHQQIPEIAAQVKVWSLSNFGDQGGINGLAPILGIMEEVGELQEAIERNSKIELILDAVGDIGIYSLDAIGRYELNLQAIWPIDLEVLEPNLSAISYAGQIAHHALKRHQGIRGYEDETFFKTELEKSMGLLLQRLENLYPMTQITIDTWNETVSKRDWKKEPNSNP